MEYILSRKKGFIGHRNPWDCRHIITRVGVFVTGNKMGTVPKLSPLHPGSSSLSVFLFLLWPPNLRPSVVNGQAVDSLHQFFVADMSINGDPYAQNRSPLYNLLYWRFQASLPRSASKRTPITATLLVDDAVRERVPSKGRYQNEHRNP